MSSRTATDCPLHNSVVLWYLGPGTCYAMYNAMGRATDLSFWLRASSQGEGLPKDYLGRYSDNSNSQAVVKVQVHSQASHPDADADGDGDGNNPPN